MRTAPKYILIMFFVLNIIALPLIAQTENCINDDEDQPCCNGIISTDPRLDPNGNPYSVNQGRSEMVNKFNWMTPSFNVYHPGPIDGYTWQGGPYNITNPFYTQYEYLSHINFYHHIYPYTSEKLDLWPEDGWELLHKNNGFQTNEIDYLETVNNRSGPYFILYNKYSGVMRFFAAVPASLIGQSRVKTEIKFWEPDDNNVSALLSEQTNISQPLDQKTKMIKIQSSSDAPSLGTFWTTDFYMAYDPCECHISSKLHFNFKTIQQADLDLTGRLIATSMPLDGSGNAPMLNGRDFLASVFEDDYDGSKTGILSYTNIDALAEKFKTPNLSFWEKAGIDALKAVFKGTGGALDGVMNTALGGPYNSFLINSGISGLLDLKGEQKLGLGIFASFSDNVKASIFPEHKIANIGFIEGEMALTGTYINEAPTSGLDFKLAVPGSKNTENSNITAWQEYPAYNEALGVFAMLETPKIKKHTSTWSIFEGIRNIVQYKMDLSSIKYYFNPALDVDYDKTKVSIAAFIPEFKSNYLNYPPYGTLNLKNLVESYPRNIDDDGNYHESTLHSYYGSAFYPIGCMGDILFEFVQEYQTPIYPTLKVLDNINNTKPIIKFLIYLVTNPNKYGKINKNILEFTYRLDVVNSENNLSNNELIEIPFDIELASFNFTNSTIINAWNDIKIIGDLTTDPGVTVELIAGSKVIVSPNSKVSPNITLKIGLPDACEPVPPVTDSYVKNFCTSQNYKANQLDLKVKEKLERQKAKEYDEFIEKNKNDFSIQPNPAATNIVLNYFISRNNSSFVKMNLLNLLGETLLELVNTENHPSGEFSIPVDVSGLSPGVYYCTMQSPLGVITKSFVVI